MKTAAYLDELPAKIPAGSPVQLNGQVICGLSGLKRVEYSLRREDSTCGASDEQAEEWLEGQLQVSPRSWKSVLPDGVSPREILGFDPKTGKPLAWPLRYSMVSWSATLKKLPAGKYSVRARAVDLNGFAQPEPRPNPKAGINALEVREFEVS